MGYLALLLMGCSPERDKRKIGNTMNAHTASALALVRDAIAVTSVRLKEWQMKLRKKVNNSRKKTLTYPIGKILYSDLINFIL